jgi:hypothetical protein
MKTDFLRKYPLSEGFYYRHVFQTSSGDFWRGSQEWSPDRVYLEAHRHGTPHFIGVETLAYDKRTDTYVVVFFRTAVFP